MTTSEIADIVENTARENFAGVDRTDPARPLPGNTAAVMQIFGKLGWRHGFKVAPGDFGGGYEAGWLYDLIWYEERQELQGRLLLRQVLVLECEWRHGARVANVADVDGDFQKLVQARADVRVWISVAHNSRLAEDQMNNCKQQVTTFAATISGDIYIFLIWDWSKSEWLVARHTAP